MPGREDVVQQMRDALALVDPSVDTSIGSLIRKIFDGVAEVVEEASADRYLVNYQYDIDTKVGADLDDFVRLWGMSRLPVKRATGTITFERNTPSTIDIYLPPSTQVSTTDTPPIIFQTITGSILVAGQTQITIPAIATVGGLNGNVPPGAITLKVSPLEGISGVTNPIAFTGGTDAETDISLRDRFRKTVFRNVAGTEQMFLALALQQPSVRRANVTGAAKRWREQIHVVSGAATSTITAASYIYPDSATFGSNLNAHLIFKEGVHYTVNYAANPPTIAIIDTTAVPDGIYELEYLYVPSASRNDPANGITNRVDVFADGIRVVEATESLAFNTASVFNTTGGSPLNRSNYARLDESLPLAGNYFVQCSFSPLVDPAITDQITISGVTYHEGVDFWLVYDTTNLQGSTRERSGIEFKSVSNGQSLAIPANGTRFTVDYQYNAVPRDIQVDLAQWGLVSQDVLAHQARFISLNIYLAVILDPGFVLSGVQADMFSRMSNFIGSIEFDRVLQVSDILSIAHQVPGVDAVRMMTSADHATNFGIQRVNGVGAQVQSFDDGGGTKRAIDVKTTDNQVVTLNSVVLSQRAENSFGTV